MTARYRLFLFLAALSLLFVLECYRLGRAVGSAYYDFRAAVNR